MRYEFFGYIDIGELRKRPGWGNEEDNYLNIFRRYTAGAQSIPIGHIIDDHNKEVETVALKEEGLLILDRLRRHGRIDDTQHTAIAVQIMNCPHLNESITNFHVKAEIDKRGRTVGVFTSMMHEELVVRSKFFALYLLAQGVNEGYIHPHYANIVRGNIIKSKLVQTYTALAKAQTDKGENVLVIVDSNGDPLNPPLRSQRQAIAFLQKCIYEGIVEAGVYKKMESSIKSSKFPTKHETDYTCFHKQGLDPGLFPEFVQ